MRRGSESMPRSYSGSMRLQSMSSRWCAVFNCRTMSQATVMHDALCIAPRIARLDLTIFCGTRAGLAVLLVRAHTTVQRCANAVYDLLRSSAAVCTVFGDPCTALCSPLRWLGPCCALRTHARCALCFAVQTSPHSHECSNKILLESRLERISLGGIRSRGRCSIACASRGVLLLCCLCRGISLRGQCGDTPSVLGSSQGGSRGTSSSMRSPATIAQCGTRCVHRLGRSSKSRSHCSRRAKNQGGE